ncbi:oligosaccharide flippase family protein [bacterium SCSIO 12741]|nr:oligosaccharide flippase family protein [bacterium SCSIO 12741]
MANPIKKLAKQTAVYGLSSILGRLLNYLLVPLQTYFFVSKEYGIISEFYAYVAFFVVVLTFGMETTFFRFVNRSEDKESVFNQATSFILLLNVLFLVLVGVFSQDIADWLQFPHYQHFVIWLGIILAADAISSLFMAKLRFQEKARKFAVVQLSSIGITIILNLVFLGILYDPNDPDSLGIGYIFLANLVASLLKPALLFREVLSFRFTWNTQQMRAMLIFAVPLVIGGFAGIINETLDRILIKRLLLDEGLDFAQSQVGIYSANYKLSILITVFIQAFRYAAEPFFFAQEKNKNKDEVYSRVMTWFIIVVSTMFLTISLNLELFKWFIPNEEYWEGLKVVPILLMANIFLGIYYNQSIWYKLANRTQYGAYISIGGAFITIGLNLYLIPIMGYEGSAWTTLSAYFFMMVASYFWGRRIYPIQYDLPRAGLYLFVSLGLYLISQFVATENPWLNALINNVMLLGFVGLIMVAEKPLQEFRKNG